MANYEMIFDLGAQYISAAIKNEGFSDKIPTQVAYGDNKQIVAVGVEAVRLANLQNIRLVRPILEGAVIDSDAVKALISSLLERLIGHKINAFGKYVVRCICPCGMISNDKKTVESIFLSLGVRSVSFVETPVADSFQLFEEFRVRQGIVANLGFDCADFAVVSGNSIVSGCTVYYSGKHLTEMIAERIRQKYLIQLPFEQAEYLKIHCASLYPNDTTVVSVSGQNTQHNVKETINVSSRELYDTLVEFAKKYVTIIGSLVSTSSDQIAPLLKTDGVLLCGGGAKLAGIDLFLQNELGVPVRVAEHPDDVSINGMLKCHA